MFKTPSNATITTAWSAILTIPIMGEASITNIEVVNEGDTAFSDFKIQMRDHPDGEFYDYLTSAEVVYSKAPDSLSASEKTHLKIPLFACDSIKLLAKVSAGTTVASARGSLSRLVETPNPADKRKVAIPGSGIPLTCTSYLSDQSITVVEGAKYEVTAETGRIYLGVASLYDGVIVDANVLWTIPAGVTREIVIPSGTTLYYYSATNGVTGRLTRVN